MKPSLLTHQNVHDIRTSGLPDAHWERLLGVTRTCVQKARVGSTWITHPTPPDTVRRMRSQGNGGRRRETQNMPQMSALDSAMSRLLTKWPRVDTEGRDVTPCA